MTDIERRRFERAYAAHFDAVARYCLRRANHEDALDATVETFTIAWRRRDDVPWNRLLPWLYGVARKVLTNQRRSSLRQRRLIAFVEPVGDDPGPETHVVRAIEEQQLLRALASLPPDDQEVIRLAAWEDLSRDDLAAALGSSTNAVTKRLNRALDRLAAELGTTRRGRRHFFRRERDSA